MFPNTSEIALFPDFVSVKRNVFPVCRAPQTITAARAMGTITFPALNAVLQKNSPFGTKAFFFVFLIGLSSNKTNVGSNVTDVTAEITMPFISTMPISKPILKVINKSASNPAIVVSALAETGFTTDFIALFIAAYISCEFSLSRR